MAIDLTALTAREREIAMLYADEALSTAEIAARLGIKTCTVRTHIVSIYNRLGMESTGVPTFNRAKLTRLVVEERMRRRYEGQQHG